MEFVAIAAAGIAAAAVRQRQSNDRMRREDDASERLETFFEGYGLSALGKAAAESWVRKAFDAKKNPHLGRVRKWLIATLNRKRAAPPCKWQKGCPEIIPGLRARASWPVSEFPWMRDFMESFAEIKAELLALRTKGCNGFQPYRAPTWANERRASDGVGSIAHDAGNWNVLYLQLHNASLDRIAENRRRCPCTMKALEAIGSRLYGHSFFSALAPNTHITSHHGPTNKKLRVHIPLVVPPAAVGRCRIRVGEEMLTAEEGIPYIFDDSLLHEAWNDSKDAVRIVLIFDVWHPDLSDQEVKFLSFLRKAKLRKEKRLCSQGTGGDDFYSILKSAAEIKATDADLWSGTPR